MKYRTTDLLVCVDCLMFVANGELPSASWGSTDDDARVIAGAGSWSDAGWQVHAGDSENDHTFSWSRCDHCHSGAGGSRHHAVAMRADTDSVRCDCCGTVCDATDSWTDGTIALCGSVYGNGCADRRCWRAREGDGCALLGLD